MSESEALAAGACAWASIAVSCAAMMSHVNHAGDSREEELDEKKELEEEEDDEGENEDELDHPEEQDVEDLALDQDEEDESDECSRRLSDISVESQYTSTGTCTSTSMGTCASTSTSASTFTATSPSSFTSSSTSASPSTSTSTSTSIATSTSASTSWVPSIHQLSTDPIIFVISNFLSESQVAQILDWKKAHEHKFQRSETSAGISQHRTSFELTYYGSLLALIRERIASITNLPQSRQESLQLIKYSPGQQFRSHVDSSNWRKTTPRGMRIYSIVIYLNNMKYEQGGGTAFEQLDMQIQPVQGHALVWKGTKDNGTCDYRTTHAGLPIIHGEKLCLVTWVTQR